jgi:hypothetical protein
MLPAALTKGRAAPLSAEISTTAYARHRQRITRRRARLAVAAVAGIALLLLWCFTGSEAAAEIFAQRDERAREYQREQYEYQKRRNNIVGAESVNEINTAGRRPRAIIPEYDQRKAWLSDMNHLWFKGGREWQDRWLQDRDLSRGKRKHE